jgi:DNA-binding transcriptional ArsR family regulator
MTSDPMIPVFRALGDPSRRLLLDRLFERDGQTLGELCAHLPEMTRFGVMRHLGVLASAGLVTTVRVGREKRHYLNPVPIRLVHDRWTSRYAAPIVGAMSAIKQRLEVPVSPIDHVYSVFIAAPPERVWLAIIDGDDTVAYYYGTRVSSAWTAGAPVTYTYPDGSVAADGSVLEIDPPNRVRLAFHPRWDPEIDAEGPVEMTWAVDVVEGSTRLTVTTAGLAEGSRSAIEFDGGIVWIVSGLKTLLETGRKLTAAPVDAMA